MNIAKLNILIISLLFSTLSYSQIPSLENKSLKDSAYILKYKDEGFKLFRSQPELVKGYANEIIRFSIKHEWAFGLSEGKKLLGVYFHAISEYDSAISLYKEAILLKDSLRHFNGVARIKNNIGLIAKSVGRHEEAFKYYFDALAYYQQNKDTARLMATHNNLGDLLMDRNNLDEAKTHYRSAYLMALVSKNQFFIALGLSNMGNLFAAKNEFEAAIERHLEALKIKKEENYQRGIAESYFNLGRIYYSLEKYSLAIEYLKKGVELSEELVYKENNANCMVALGKVYQKMGLYYKSNKFFEKGIVTAYAIDNSHILKNAYTHLYAFHEKNKDYEEAFNFLKKLRIIDQKLFNDRKEYIIQGLQTKYKTQKREEENRILKEENENIAQAFAQQRSLIIAIIIFLIVAIALLIFTFSENRLKRRANFRLLEQHKVIALQNEELEESTTMLESKNKSITDSILYASKIQNALLPLENVVQSNFKEHFILFQPMDIVSGDLYWFHVSHDKIFIAIADCTGHGVPGAFMSVLGNTLLRESVIQKKLYKPDEILQNIKNALADHLKPHETDNVDGMDIGICVISTNEKKMYFSSSRMPLYLFIDGEEKLIKGDKIAIGGKEYREDQQFINHEINWENTLQFYMYSDGYQDQFGGKRGKKFMSKKFRRLLSEIRHLEMSEQKEILLNKHNEWKGTQAQTDDILVSGFKV